MITFIPIPTIEASYSVDEDITEYTEGDELLINIDSIVSMRGINKKDCPVETIINLSDRNTYYSPLTTAEIKERIRFPHKDYSNPNKGE